MKQVTGNNAPQPATKVSIQLALDGHSFSVADPVTLPAGGPVEVELLTPRTLLVPSELFDERCAGELLAAAGMPPAEQECTVCSDPQQEIVAVMAAPCDSIRQVRDRFGEEVRFTTPLLAVPRTTKATVWLRHAAGLLYIKVYDETLRFAEVIPAPTDADILYFLERLGGEFPLQEYGLCIAGDNAKALKRLFGERFRESACE